VVCLVGRFGRRLASLASFRPSLRHNALMDSKVRFSDRVDDYVRFRPGYPDALLEMLARACGLQHGTVVADIGSGTGILSRQLLSAGARVVAVEPNAAMRAAAERALGGEPGFTSVDGSAEATGLEPGSVDLVTAAQAFHWFDVPRARVEMRRVLRPAGWVALVWNVRTSTPFNDAYEQMLEDLAPDYPAVRARDRVSREAVDAFFAPDGARTESFPNAQQLDEPGLRGRLQSSSYAPKPGQPTHAAISRRLDEIFATHAQQGRVEITYEAVVYWGRPGSA
jgi:ubiquinone/menaquinone biosynthesis C-methylase UbiE